MIKRDPFVFSDTAHFFRLREDSFIYKDDAMMTAFRAVLNTSLPEGVRLVFAGGTSLARAYRITDRMSEDVDMKVVFDNTMSKSQARKVLSNIKDSIRNAILGAGLRIGNEKFRNENRLMDFFVGFDGPANQVLRSDVKLEFVQSSVRLPTTRMPMASMIHEAFGAEPEIPSIECVSMTETAAEKIVSLTRRTAGALEGSKPEVTDRFQVRHIYDLYWISKQPEFDRETALKLANEIALSDAAQFANWFPGYASDPQAWTAKALDYIENDPTTEGHYREFSDSMVYGTRPAFSDAFAVVHELATQMWSAESKSTLTM